MPSSSAVPMTPTSTIGAVDGQRAVVGAELGVVGELDVGVDRAEAEQAFVRSAPGRAGAGDRAAYQAVDVRVGQVAAAEVQAARGGDGGRAGNIGAGGPDAVAADGGRAGHVEVGTLNAAAAEHAADGVDVEHAVGR